MSVYKGRYHQGFFKPLHPEKYIGNLRQIIYRSGLEKSYMHRFDSNPHIIAWGSEEFFIPYFSPIDKKKHRYFVDFFIKYKNKNNEIKKAIIEIKPKAFTFKPKKPKKMTKGYLNRINEYAVNLAKWEAAKLYAKRNNMEFLILTEFDLRSK